MILLSLTSLELEARIDEKFNSHRNEWMENMNFGEKNMISSKSSGHWFWLDYIVPIVCLSIAGVVILFSLGKGLYIYLKQKRQGVEFEDISVVGNSNVLTKEREI